MPNLGMLGGRGNVYSQIRKASVDDQGFIVKPMLAEARRLDKASVFDD